MWNNTENLFRNSKITSAFIKIKVAKVFFKHFRVGYTFKEERVGGWNAPCQDLHYFQSSMYFVS